MERRDIHSHWTAKAALVLAMTLALPIPLFAQASPSPGSPPESVGTFQLPPGKAPPPPPAAGPVDPELPAPAPVQAIPPPAAQPDPTPPLLAPQPSPPALVLPQSPDEPSRAPASGSAPRAQPAGRDLPAPAPSTPEPATITGETGSNPAASSPPTPPVAAPAPGSLHSPPWPLWLAGGALLALLLAGIGIILRRRRHSDEIDDAGHGEDPPLPVAKAPMPALRTPIARTPLSPSQVKLVFEPQHLTMALVNATLAYRLSLTNLSDAAIGPVSIAGDIISAHTSLGEGKQLLLGVEGAEPRHQFPSLEPGECLSLTGELQLPIAAIRPIRSGEASLFIPLARFCTTVLNGSRPPLVCTSVFIIGESPEQPGQRLRPIRIDKGPRTLSRISQRELELPA